MKKKLLLFALCFFATKNMYAQVSVTGVSLDTTSLTLGIGEVYLLTPTITPNTAANQKITWTTSDADVATVSFGLITAKKTGITDIIVTTIDGSFTDTCAVTVVTIPVTSVSLNKDTIRLDCGDCYQLTTTVTPNNATDKSVSFISENLYVATVSPTGLIWAGDPDTTRIIVETNDGNFKDTCVVIVDVPITTSVREVSLNKRNITLVEGDTFRLEETVLPNNASNKKVVWYTKDYTTATVSSGLVTAERTGSTIIYVKTIDKGKTDSCFINIIPKDFVVIDSEVNTNATINFSVVTPENIFPLAGSFFIGFPEGISLNENTTQLSNEYETSSSLTITEKDNNSWFIEIEENTSVSHDGTLQNLMSIGYNVDESVKNGDYNILFSEINIKLNDGSELKKDTLNFKMNIDDTANDPIDTKKIHVFRANNRLHIQSVQAETIYIYSFNGSLLYTKEKAAGEIVFDLNIQESIIIVKGSSGWTQKVTK